MSDRLQKRNNSPKIFSMSGKEPTQEQCKTAAEAAVQSSRKELEDRGIGWDFVTEKLKEEAAYEQPVIVKHIRSIRSPTKKKILKRVIVNKVVRLVTPEAMSIRQKARIDAHKLRGDYPPEEHRVAGPGGGPIALQGLTVEFVTSGQAKKKERSDKSE